MKAFAAMLIIATVLGVSNFIQSYRLDQAKTEIKQLTAELDATRAAQRADRETFAMQIKLVREASKYAQNAHKELADKAGLSDTDWLESMLAGMWNKNTDGSATAAGMDAGAVPGTGSSAGAATGQNPAAVQ